MYYVYYENGTVGELLQNGYTGYTVFLLVQLNIMQHDFFSREAQRTSALLTLISPRKLCMHESLSTMYVCRKLFYALSSLFPQNAAMPRPAALSEDVYPAWACLREYGAARSADLCIWLCLLVSGNLLAPCLNPSNETSE